MQIRAILTAAFLAVPISAIAQTPRYTPLFLSSVQPGPINAIGQVIGRTTVAGNLRGVVMRAGAPEELLPLPPGMVSAVANDINDAGVVVGQVGPYYSPEFSGRAVAWYPNALGGWSVTVFGVLPGHVVASARAVNNLGDIVGYSGNGTYRTPVLFRASGEVMNLASTGIFDPMDVNDRRIVVDNSNTAKRLNLETMIVEDLGVPDPPGDTHYRATWTAAINESNQVVGSAILTTSTRCDRQATRYTDGRGWEMYSTCGPNNGASDINDRGDMVMCIGITPYARFEDGGTVALEDLIVNGIGHWYAVTTTAGWINNARQIVMYGTNPTTGQTGTLLLAPEAAADVPGGSVVGRVALTAHPNPFRVGTTVQYSLASPGTVDLAIYDLAGRRVATLLNAATRSAGVGDVTWYGRDDGGVDMAGGVYFARLTVGGVAVRQRVVLLR